MLLQVSAISAMRKCGECHCEKERMICRQSIPSVLTIMNRQNIKILDFRGTVGNINFEDIESAFNNLKVLDVRGRTCEDNFTYKYTFEVISDCIFSTEYLSSNTYTVTVTNISFNTKSSKRPSFKTVTITWTNEFNTTAFISNSTLKEHKKMIIIASVLSCTLVTLITVCITCIYCLCCQSNPSEIDSIKLERLRQHKYQPPVNQTFRSTLFNSPENLSAESIELFSQKQD